MYVVSACLPFIVLHNARHVWDIPDLSLDHPLSYPRDCVPASLSLSLSLHPEYQSLDSQLDQLADYLTVLEGRGDRLTRDAQQLLLEVQGSRQNGTVPEQEQNGTETVESAESLEQNGTETVESAESLEQNVDTNQPSAGQS